MSDVHYFQRLYAAALDFTMKAYYANILSQYGPVTAVSNVGVSSRSERLMQKLYDRMV